MTDINHLLTDCLYFTANKLARVIGKMAEEEFRITGLSPTHAFLVNIVNEKEGVTQKEIGEALHMTPSTITRFVDKLEGKGLVERRSEGKNAYIYATGKGKALQVDIDKAWNNLYKRYSEITGYEEGDQLTAYLDKVGDMLEAK